MSTNARCGNYKDNDEVVKVKYFAGLCMLHAACAVFLSSNACACDLTPREKIIVKARA